MNSRVQVLYEHVLSFLLGIYLAVDWLDRMVSVCLIFNEIVALSSKVLYHFAFPPAMYKSPVDPSPHKHLVLSVFKILIILIVVWWYLRVALFAFL